MSYPTQTDNGYKFSINQDSNYFTKRNWLINTREDILKYSNTNMNEQWKRAYQNLADALNMLDAMIARCEVVTCQMEEINNDLEK
jgi:hemoglobin-like flavoprotein